jgi:hypothetical protein
MDSPGIQNHEKIGNQPPQKNKLKSELIKRIFAYSPKKNKAKAIEEYSTLYPATNSASASGKSNGALFVSANAAIKNINQRGNKGKINQMEY